MTAAKSASADLLETAVLEIAGVFSGGKELKQLQRVWEGRLRENSVVVVEGKRLRAESFQQNLQNKSIGLKDTFLQSFLNIHVGKFSVPTFCGSFWKTWRESPSCGRCLVVPRKTMLSNYLTR